MKRQNARSNKRDLGGCDRLEGERVIVVGRSLGGRFRREVVCRCGLRVLMLILLMMV